MVGIESQPGQASLGVDLLPAEGLRLVCSQVKDLQSRTHSFLLCAKYKASLSRAVQPCSGMYSIILL